MAAACGIATAQQRGPLGLAQKPSRSYTDRPAASIRADVGLVTIPVSVTDAFGAPYHGLTKERVRLFEDNIEQQIKHFSVQEAPVSLGIVFDASRSMEGRVVQSREAMKNVFKTALPGDEYFLVEFNDAPRVVLGFTEDEARIQDAALGIQPMNWTALYDAVYFSMQQMRRARNSRKALLILSDGGDNRSRYSEAEMKRFVQEGDVSIYSIAIADGFLNRHPGVLKRLSEATGGQSYAVRDIRDLPEAVDRISAAIRHQYLLGYTPTNEGTDGLYRKVTVQLSREADKPSLRVAWRNGYYAPVGP
jgi:VWFA-related protein